MSICLLELSLIRSMQGERTCTWMHPIIIIIKQNCRDKIFIRLHMQNFFAKSACSKNCQRLHYWNMCHLLVSIKSAICIVVSALRQKIFDNYHMPYSMCTKGFTMAKFFQKIKKKLNLFYFLNFSICSFF